MMLRCFQSASQGRTSCAALLVGFFGAVWMLVAPTPVQARPNTPRQAAPKLPVAKKSRTQKQRRVAQARGRGRNVQGTRVEGSKRRCRVKWNVRVAIDFDKSKIIEVVRWIAKLTCQNFIISSRVQGQQLNIISSKKVTVREAYRAFFAALQANQMTAYRVGSYWNIIYTRDSRRSPIRTYTRKNARLPYREEVITYLHRLQHLDVNQVAGLVRQLSSPSGGIIPYQAGSILIITDYAPNLRRVRKILNTLDVPQDSTRDNVYVLQVQHAEAQAIAQKLQQLFQIGQPRTNTRRRVVRRTRRGRNTKRKRRVRAQVNRNTGKSDDDSGDAYRITKMVADERTNQIIVLSNPRAIKRVSKLLKDLDIPLPNDGQIWVHRLKFASSDELAQTLSQLTRGTQQRRRTRRRGRGTSRRKAAEQFEGEVKITADKATNSLVVIASRRDYDSLKRVIAELDRARKQVFVEIVVMEVSQDKSRELGLVFHGGANVTGDTANPSVGLLGTQLSGLNSLVLSPSALLGLAFGLRGAEVPNTSGLFGSTTGLPSFGVVLRAIQSNTDVDIISTPHILTTANKEATLQVGQNVPFIAGTTFTGAAQAGVPPIRNIQRQDVALTLKIKPQVDAGDYIRLDFEQELTELAGNDPELGPTTTKRRIKTVVLARNKQTIVIGGLMRDKVTYGTSKVPILGDIPLLGALFRVRKRSVAKTNLLVFLTPHIITNMEDFRQIFRQKMDERKEFLQLFHTKNRKAQLWKYRNYERTFGFVEKVDMMVRKGKAEAAEMRRKKLQLEKDKKTKAARRQKEDEQTPKVKKANDNTKDSE